MVLAFALVTSLVLQPRESAEGLRLAVHAGVLALLWRELSYLEYGNEFVILSWTLYATLLHLAGLRFKDEWTRYAGHAIFAASGLWLLGRFAWGLLTVNPDRTAVLHPIGLASLGVIALAGVTYLLVRQEKAGPAVGLWLHLAFLGWTGQELGLLAEGNGNAYVTIAWGAYALLLIAAGLRLANYRVLLYLGISTLFAVAAKLFLIDLQYLEAIWRILLFLGFGGLFLLISYYFQNVARRAES
jgi:uncharacterized membrane protein